MFSLHWLLAVFVLALLQAPGTRAAPLESPDGALMVEASLDAEGRPGYQLFRNGEAVIGRSPLGVSLQHTVFRDALTMVSVSEPTRVAERYRLKTGKKAVVSYEANESRQCMANTDSQKLCVTFRLSNDGLAYRYEFPDASDHEFQILSEHSGVQFFPETRAWLQPKAEAQSGWKNTNPSYEEDYRQEISVGVPSTTESGWVFPALFRYHETWILLSEAGMDGGYPGSNLAQESADGLYRLRFPQDAEVVADGGLLPRMRAPFHSPWRLIAVGDLATIVHSTLGTDLAEPLAFDDTGFVEPGVAVWSWGLLKDDSVVFDVQAEFVNYAAWMNWPYVLVDVNWDRNIGYEKIADLAAYAAKKDVGLFLWYNSSGDWNQTDYSPKSRLLTRADRRAEFQRLQGIGIRGIKVDFFPGDGASVMKYYVDILSDAADFGLMVNFHGTTLPRGLQRTYPNLVTSEAVKGFEMVTFFQDFADQEATHVAMLPFTRNLFDPMDFTPMVLGDIPGIERRTSNGFQLALPVLFTSGVQHLVTTPEQMSAVPESVRDYLRQLPGQWDESRFLDGYPGRYVVIARRSGKRWYVVGINAGTEARMFAPDLSFVPARMGSLIADGDQPRKLVLAEVSTGHPEIAVAPSSGFVMIFNN